ncbi:MAG: bifunctional 4-hydroxy-2-oxoglutarate aldolase/2-dehydro-3-deoxy-phosphogluconate aldolase [Phycisphaeraceae bacterium]|nr:bifunctional 4-hydroxy-2-oxoglutarate aldolase/2-dehydro-3-deoxy-phosphogluconate aldolase [Phycisphaeraceae bacterium]
MSTADAIIRHALIAIIRLPAPDQPGGLHPHEFADLCRALADGNLPISEITLNTPNALDAIHHASTALAVRAHVGAGTVLTPQACHAAIDAGASFIVTPNLNPDVIDAAHQRNTPVIPGVLTPTEAQQAHHLGADFIKVFPANLFGPPYIRDLLAPLPHLRLVPTGGVRLDNLSQWLTAGATALGVGSSLLQKDLIIKRDWPALTALARQWSTAIQSHKPR